MTSKTPFTDMLVADILNAIHQDFDRILNHNACPFCAGTGSVLSMPSVPGARQHEEPCEDCNGTGER